MILVTGGAGYIGSHTNKVLHNRGYKTVVFDNLSRGRRELVKWGAFIQGDLLDQNSIGSVFKKYPVEAVIHFAAFAYVGESVENPARYYRNNVVGTLNLLDAMREHGVNKLIFSSSCAVYGDPVQIPITESHPRRPVNPYGQSKLVAENLLVDYRRAYGLQFVSLRYFNAAGADPDREIGEWHDPETHLIPLILDAALQVRPGVTIFGTDYATPDGTCIRDYIHVMDLVHAHVLGLEYLLAGKESDFFNLGSGSGLSVRQVVESVKAVTGLEVPVVTGNRRQGDPAHLVASPEKIMKKLGWKPCFNFDQLIQTAYLWHRVMAPKKPVP